MSFYYIAHNDFYIKVPSKLLLRIFPPQLRKNGRS